MNNKQLSAEEILLVASSPWASAKEIMKIGGVGRNKAHIIRNHIAKEYYKENIIRNRWLVPMQEVLKYFNIDLGYLKEVSINEK